ncbi:cell division protein PerM [Corynebacterium segmentosum]
MQTERAPRAPHATATQKPHNSAERVARKAGSKAKARRTPAPLTKAGRIRQLFMSAVLPNIIVVLIIVALAFGALLLFGSPLAWLPTIVAEAWMVFNLAPVSAAGVDLSFLPALPALILATVVAVRVRAAVKHKVSVKDLAILVACVVGVPVVLTCIAWVMLWDAGKVFDVSPPNLAAALARVIVVHLAAMAAGMGTRLWRALAKRYGAPPLLVDAALIALRYLAYLAIGATVVFVLIFIVNFSRQGEMMDEYPSISGLGVFTLILLSLLYIPNAIVSTGAVLVGSEFSAGEAQVSLFSTHLVPLPPLPITGGIPASSPGWAVVFMVVPLIAATMSLYKKRPSFQKVLAATVATAVIMFFACYLVSGTLGYYGHTGPHLWTAAGLAALWIAVVGLAVAAAFALMNWRDARAAEAEAESSAEEVAEAEASEEDSEDAAESAEDTASEDTTDAEQSDADKAEADEADGDDADADLDESETDEDENESESSDGDAAECAAEETEDAADDDDAAAESTDTADTVDEVIEGEVVEDSDDGDDAESTAGDGGEEGASESSEREAAEAPEILEGELVEEDADEGNPDAADSTESGRRD